MNYTFAKDAWDLKELTYAYSYRFEETPVFTQAEGFIQNNKNEQAVYGYDNISLMTLKKYQSPVTLSVTCEFEDLGAPLLVIAPNMEQDRRGVWRYGEYLEVVLWKNGVNVWRMWMEEGEVTWKQLMGVEFSVNEEEQHTLSVRIHQDTLYIQADDKVMQLYIENMYPSYHLGMNACEGINRFYEMEITEKTKNSDEK